MKHIVKLIILFLIPAFLIISYSCEKHENINEEQGKALLNINIDLIDFDSEVNLQASNNGGIEENTKHIQYTDNDFYLESELIPIENATTKKNLQIQKTASTPVREKLDEDIRYTLLVYDSNGKLEVSKNYTHGVRDTTTSISLLSNVEYTFVVVSSRSKSTVPTIINENNLETATISNINASLLYWKSPNKIKLKVGQNYLSAKLQPKFSEITTTLLMDNEMTGAITAITSPRFTPTAEKISLKLSDGSLSYGYQNPKSILIDFGNLGNTGKRSATSLGTTTIIADENRPLSLKFNSLQVDSETKSNITVDGLIIRPGHRYNLILTLKTCTEAVNGFGRMEWSFDEVKNGTKTGIYLKPDEKKNKDKQFKENGEIISFTFEEAGADYGFVYDITELDNAFNLEINGTPIVGTDIMKDEIQFQNNATLTTQNIEFEDGTQYQSQAPAIWNLKGTPSKPMVKVVISRFGDVMLYGSKESNGELYPLRLKNNKKFNKVTWHGGTTVNKIKATTRVEGKTVMKSTGSGRRKIPCSK